MNEKRVLENEELLIEINDFGAELARIYDKGNTGELSEKKGIMKLIGGQTFGAFYQIKVF